MIIQDKLDSCRLLFDVAEIRKFFSTEPLDLILKNNGFIAGGFPLRCLREKGMPLSYMKGEPFKGPTKNIYINLRPDIDVFFEKRSDYEKTLVDFEMLEAKSHYFYFDAATQNTMTYGLSPSGVSDMVVAEGMVRCNIQLINLAFMAPKEILESFDLVNSMVGFNREMIWYDDRLLDLLTSNTISIMNVQGLRTIQRVGKYFAKHGFDHVDNVSKEMILGWLIAHADEQEQDVGRALASLEFSSEGKILSDSDLVYFWNKFQVESTELENFEYEEFVEAALKRRHSRIMSAPTKNKVLSVATNVIDAVDVFLEKIAGKIL